jgi:4-hydroxybenzoyl-CoA thioesterase/acyl-CoA thioester hydrolase
MSEPYRTTRRVEFRDTDAAGIAHFSAFFFYMESVEHEFLRSLGLSVLGEEKTSGSTGLTEAPVTWPRVSASCDFQSAVRFEDVLDISLQVARLGEKSVTYKFEFSCADRQVATGKTIAVCCRFSAGAAPHSISIPAAITEKLRAFAKGADTLPNS